ncbi:hypothetical protein OEZ60_17540 [Defluviimonas sp. WL0024]|uniref:DUF2946 domain-containing protein n=2 Tax=Albidovulum TaxID=205889 RepID=A0ABT3J8N3_9RHOB|nr:MULTISPECIES: hypothetical protein [Defluviimonas]MCU9849804.1 hypothetical protein [Defluviimonas sp. WL0024]MCW3784049.1 hypothetical protein [Defluviimonas salinarum]
MTRPTFRSALILTLALALAAMGVAAAAARGQVRAGGEALVLCSGAGLVQVPRDATGAPSGPAHLCPDLALGLLAAVTDPAPAEAARPVTPVKTSLPAAKRVPGAAAPAPFGARGPPVPV